MDSEIRLGILGPGSIFRRVMTDMPNAKGVRVTAVASRDAGRGAEAARLCGARYVFTRYEDLAACPDVDLVYIATPHNFHCEQALLCMRAGKHVICEKPMALNGDEARRMAACAREMGVFLMEAMWTRFFPAMARVRELIASGAIGQVLHMTADFSYRGVGVGPQSRLWSRDLAGGGLLDVGVYAIEAVTDILGWKPEQVQGLCKVAETGVDARFAVQMLYPSGATAQIGCGCDVTMCSTEMIYGSEGMIEIPEFWHPTRFTLRRASGEEEVHTFRPENEGHHYEFMHAADCIRKGLGESPVITLEETAAVADIMTRLRREQGIVYPQEQ